MDIRFFSIHRRVNMLELSSDDVDDSKVVEDVHVPSKTVSIIEDISVDSNTLIIDEVHMSSDSITNDVSEIFEHPHA